MSHVRTQIRDAFVSRLTGLATTGARCYGSRLRPPAAVEPFLLVFIGDEDSDTTVGGEVRERRAQLVVVAVAKEQGDMEDRLDQILLEVEIAVATAADQTFGGLIKAIGAPSVSPDVSDGLEKPVGINEIRYPITYYTAATNPATPL